MILLERFTGFTLFSRELTSRWGSPLYLPISPICYRRYPASKNQNNHRRI
nr:MAG TPA: hypothetical protein [Caudoviricetes sp.]